MSLVDFKEILCLNQKLPYKRNFLLLMILVVEISFLSVCVYVIRLEVSQYHVTSGFIVAYNMPRIWRFFVLY